MFSDREMNDYLRAQAAYHNKAAEILRKGYPEDAGNVDFHGLHRDTLVACAERISALRASLENMVSAYKMAEKHITKDLQTEFKKLAETGQLSFPWEGEYNQSQAAMRLATWWHGVGPDAYLAEAEEALNRHIAKSQNNGQ